MLAAESSKYQNCLTRMEFPFDRNERSVDAWRSICFRLLFATNLEPSWSNDQRNRIRKFPRVLNVSLLKLDDRPYFSCLMTRAYESHRFLRVLL
jgi:hypothetical protein